MARGNTILLADSYVTGSPFVSEKIRIQSIRDEQIGFFVHCQNADGSLLQIKGAPDDAALLIGSHDGMVLHTILNTGTAGAGQTKVNGSGFAYVTVQSLPIMFIRIAGGTGLSTWNCWLVE